MNKYGRTLTNAEKQRLYRLRETGALTDDMAGSEVLALLDAPRQKRGPKTTHTQIPHYIRRKLKENFGYTPTQLASLPEKERKRIWQLVIASRGKRIMGLKIKDQSLT